MSVSLTTVESVLGTCELQTLREWMRTQGWDPLAHQEEAWAAQLKGRSGIVAVPTGMGKTYAAYFGALARAVALPRKGLRVLWISPLRAMARDIEKALSLPVAAAGWKVTVASRTGDTSASQKRKLRSRPPEVLLTTPESLSLMLSYADAPSLFASVDTVVVDEWHELCGTKRGTQTELALSRIRSFSPDVRTWALSATHGDVEALGRAAAGAQDPDGLPLCVVRSAEESRPDLRVLEPNRDD
ncbi:MAG: ATP-dependent Lhr-like helicase, partial [Flavobacteriales bacterium]